ncbi:hypothetical protein [Streptomyces sp. NPDC021224]|uniref:hypothetical protein n=1 Tax=unclassified Streptomyces TaxID=2593676 RepID=UPI00379AB988
MVGKDLKVSSLRKEIREVVEELLAKGWSVHTEGHKGRLYCPCALGCTTIPVPGTPSNPGSAARRIRSAAARCPKPEDSPQRSLARKRDATT